jgi:hypothetical protein
LVCVVVLTVKAAAGLPHSKGTQDGGVKPPLQGFGLRGGFDRESGGEPPHSKKEVDSLYLPM